MLSFWVLILTCLHLSSHSLAELSLASNNTNLFESAALARGSAFIYRDRHYAIAGFAQVNWFQANHICNTVGMALATISGLEHHIQLADRVAAHFQELRDLRFWLAGTNLVRRHEWTWLTNGLPVTYDVWDSNEPRVSPEPGCLLLGPNKRWQSRPCHEEYFFICENQCPLDSYAVSLNV